VVRRVAIRAAGCSTCASRRPGSSSSTRRRSVNRLWKASEAPTTGGTRCLPVSYAPKLQRPEQSAIELGQRVKLVVRSIAHTGGRQQEPSFFMMRPIPPSSTTSNCRPIGREKIREKFRVSQDRCVGAGSDWDQIKDLQKRELYDRHIRRFDTCMGGTAEAARRALATLALSSAIRSRRSSRQGRSTTATGLLPLQSIRRGRRKVPGVAAGKA